MWLSRDIQSTPPTRVGITQARKLTPCSFTVRTNVRAREAYHDATYSVTGLLVNVMEITVGRYIYLFQTLTLRSDTAL